MCGFIGYLSDHHFPSHCLDESFGFISYRGFIHGSYSEPTAGVSCARLPRSGSATRAQPVLTRSREVFCFNGQIYNLAVLNPSRAFVEQGASDTELLADWLTQDDGNVSQKIAMLRGEYALALISKDRSLVHLARDSFGSKPLFWAVNNGVIAFGSSARGVARIAFKAVDLDIEEFLDTFWFGASYSGSCFKGVHAVTPGMCISVSLGGIIRKNLIARPQCDPLEEALKNAVIDRVSEPKHTYVSFSGGVDSLLVAHQVPNVSRLTLEQASVLRYNYPTTIFPVRRQDIVDNLTSYVEAHERPIISLTGVALYCLAKYASSIGFSSSLSGEGADEIFGGYCHYFISAEGHPQVRHALLSRNLFLEMMGCANSTPVSPFISSICDNPRPLDWLRFDRQYRLPQHICSANSDIPSMLAGIDARLPYLDLMRFSIVDILSGGPKPQLYSLAGSITGNAPKKQGLYIPCSFLWEKLPLYMEDCHIPLITTCFSGSLQMRCFYQTYSKIKKIPEGNTVDVLKNIFSRIIIAIWSTTKMLAYNPRVATVKRFTTIHNERLEDCERSQH